jgi:glycosyltransferase involved in cell wall biosynthesis
VIVGPAFNEAKRIENVLKRTLVLYNNIIVVDNYSSDNTVEIVKKFDVQIIIHKEKKVQVMPLELDANGNLMN